MKKLIKWLNLVLFPLVKMYWSIRPRTFSGVKVIITRGSEFLLVRHTYGSDKWKFPGGKIKKEENALQAAKRELYEELISAESLRSLGLVSHTTKQYSDTVEVFTGEMMDDEIMTGIEIQTFQWHSKADAPLAHMSEITKKAFALL